MNLVILLISNVLNADIARNVLSCCSYHNQVIVCTGIGAGETFPSIFEAKNLRRNGSIFSEIYVIEENDILFNHSQFVMAQHIKYHQPRNCKFYPVYHANPVKELASIIKDINKPITFVLSSQFPDWTIPEKQNLILEELDQIKQHHIKRHVILIDYIYFGNVDIESIKKKLLEINSHYIFKLEKGGHLGREENAVLAAFFDSKN